MNERPRAVITISQPVWEAYEGRYFLGQTPQLSFGPETRAWAALVNPCGSDVLLHVAVLNITNLSSASLEARVLFAPTLSPVHGVSAEVTPADLSIHPLPCPRIQLWYQGDTVDGICNGINALTRTVPPCQTIVAEKEGKFVFPPGTAFAVDLSVLVGCSTVPRATTFASFGWWEEYSIGCM